jgi:diguanylate cyclase (GGDEF)-like protein
MDQQTLLATILLACTLLIVHLVFVAWSRRQAPAGKAVTFILLAIAIYSGGYAAQIMTVEPAAIRFWIKVQYVGIIALPQLWLLICVRYTNVNLRIYNRMTRVLAWIIPLVFLLLVFTEHPLHYADFYLIHYGELTLPVIKPGLAYILYSIYANLFLIAGGIVLTQQLRNAAEPLRKPGWLIFIGAVILWFSYIAYTFGFGPPGLDLTPFFLTVSAIIWTIALFSQHFLDIRPIALEMLFESMQSGVILYDVKNRIIEYNPNATLILPELNAVNMGKDLSVVLANYPLLSDYVTDTHADRLALSINRAEGNSHYQCNKQPMSRNGKLVGTCLVLRDDTSEELLRQQMELEVSRDYLTGAYTRRFLGKKGDSFLTAAQQNGSPFSIIMLDLDRYKQINDTLGHQVGDMILQNTVVILQSHIPEDAQLIRYGGDEFVVLMPQMDLQQTSNVAEQLCTLLKNTSFNTSMGELYITLSCGVAQMQTPDDTLATLIGLADQAVYLAKQAGGDCVRCVQ